MAKAVFRWHGAFKEPKQGIGKAQVFDDDLVSGSGKINKGRDAGAASGIHFAIRMECAGENEIAVP
jgi:hypothetical protein